MSHSTLTKTCSICKEEKPLESFRDNKEGRLGKQGRCRPCDDAYVTEWRSKNKEQFQDNVRGAYFKRTFGITLDDYDRMLTAQNGVCAICKRTDPDGKRLAVDHDHFTDEVRGLLCRPCNVAIGLLGDDPDRMAAMIQYVKR